MIYEYYFNTIYLLLLLKNLLALTQNEREATSLTFGYNKLMEMGKQFKILGMVPATMEHLLNNLSIYGFVSNNVNEARDNN